jgi:acetoin utilization deacetylase AcuC-like enzyme
MTTALFTHDACLNHNPGRGHPESPERLRAVLRALEGEAFERLARLPAPPATREQLLRIHPDLHVDRVMQAIPTYGHADIDADTIVSPGSGEAALRAAGAVCAAIDSVVAGEVRNAFCAVRPPGHHAEPDQAMGFCLFNNVAVGAAHARAVYGLQRIAIIDFDVHHGNGTQTIAYADRDIFYGSSHQWPLYPGTGSVREQGPNANVVNVCLPPRSSGAEFQSAMSRTLLPALDQFQPDLLLISAGFDAHTLDPLGGLNLTEADFHWITMQLLDIAWRHCGGRLVSVLEGGYHLEALATSSAAHVRALMTQ